MTTFVLVLILAIIIVMISLNSYAQYKTEINRDDSIDKKNVRINALRRRYGELTSCISLDTYPDTIFVFEQTQYLVIGYTACRFDCILNVTLSCKSQVGGWKCFGLFEIRRVDSSTNSVNSKSRDYTVTIFVDSLSVPTIKFCTNDINDANKLVALVQLIINRYNS